ncbi:unnamed protein product [Ranitomeya imitator]|uniref:Uncharacterized protein n=1 Tax=Ranitomeya imitator TaxID=111125 RepID=A0ABN9MBE1_9NEOB|nr:unnamed protein product [Ranitomeya imitator]
MLPKIHKYGNPGRLVISCVGTLTDQVSGWVEGILKPLVKDTPSYFQDTTDLLNKQAAIGPLPEGIILATMDVKSLYSNNPHQDGLNTCKFFLENTGTDADSVVKLIKFILTHNYFEFDNKIYLQENGTAMGKSEPQLKTFHEQFNQFHRTINLTLNYSCTEINFLDTIIKLQNNEIEISLYQKPINRPTYLKWDSFHPKHIKKTLLPTAKPSDTIIYVPTPWIEMNTLVASERPF